MNATANLAELKAKRDLAAAHFGYMRTRAAEADYIAAARNAASPLGQAAAIARGREEYAVAVAEARLADENMRAAWTAAFVAANVA